MNTTNKIVQEIKNLAAEFRTQLLEMIDSIRRNGPANFFFGAGKPVPADGTTRSMDPIKFKRALIRIIKILIIFELVGAFIDGVERHDWGRFANDIIIAGLLVLLWGRIMSLLRTKKEEYKRRMDISNQNLKLRDALIFSLLWSDEIFSNIPEDRRRIVVISYSLLSIGILVAITRLGGKGLMPFALSGALVLAAVNLLIWVASLERDEKENLRTELKLAHDVQVSLMPEQAPAFAGFDIAGISIPAKEVGGDHYDYTFLNGDQSNLAISVFDVSGKGMKAALAAVFTSGAFSSEVKMSNSPAAILTQLNRSVYSHTKRGNFVAFLLTVINVHDKTLTFSNAGQTKPLYRSATGTQWLDSVGVNFPLGMKDDSSYEEKTVQLQPGDTLFFLTDGLTDAMNGIREPYGYERVEQYISRIPIATKSAKEILDATLKEVNMYAGNAPQHDDITMVVIKIS